MCDKPPFCLATTEKSTVSLFALAALNTDPTHVEHRLWVKQRDHSCESLAKKCRHKVVTRSEARSILLKPITELLDRVMEFLYLREEMLYILHLSRNSSYVHRSVPCLTTRKIGD